MIWNKLFGKKQTVDKKINETEKEQQQPKQKPEILSQDMADEKQQGNQNDSLSEAQTKSLAKEISLTETSFVKKDDAEINNAVLISEPQKNSADFLTQSVPIAQPSQPSEIFAEKLFRFDDEAIVISHKSPDTAKQKSRLVQFLEGLKKSRQQITGNLGSIFSGQAVSIEMLDDLEDILLESDLGTETAQMLRAEVEKAKFGKNSSEQEIKDFLKQEIQKLLAPAQKMLTISRSNKPNVMIFVGVNGSGKTTTIGKFAKHFKDYQQKVMLVAADTFRAAAVEQLTIWGQRNDVPVFARESGADAAGLVYDAYAKAQQENIDILMIDTAGRLQNKHNLMQELLKIVRVLQKYDANLPHEIILVLDATTGQNAMRQAEVFRDMANISGLIVTKLDGSAKGGVLVSVGHKMKLPVYAIGIGENISDLRLFNAEDFSKALVGIEAE